MESEELEVTRFIQVSPLQSIKTKLIVFALVATILPSLTLGALSYFQNRQLLQDKLASVLRNATKQTAGEVELWLRARSYEIKVFTSSYVVSENLQRMLEKDEDNIEHLVAQDRIKSYLKSIRKKFIDYRELVIVDMAGDPLVTSNDRDPSVRLPQQWRHQIENGLTVIGAPYWDLSLKRRVITLAEPIKSADNRQLGILATKADLGSISQILQLKAAEGVDEIYMTSTNGRLIISSNDLTGNATISAFAGQALAPDGQFSNQPSLYTSFRGQEVIGLGTRMETTNWAVVAEISKSRAFADILRLGRIIILMLAILLLVMGAFAYLLAQTIVKPLKRLSEKAGKVAAGDLDVGLPVRGNSEMSYLTQVFNHMISSLRRSRSEISAAHDALVEKNRELHQLSITDGLTGLNNRKHLMDLFDMEFLRAQRYNVPFSVLIADLDHFKNINDTYGHLAGDAVLQRIADTLRDSVRECDHVGRYGGEEFLIILPSTDTTGAMEMAERLRETISQVAFFNDGKEFAMTLSVGVAWCKDGSDSVEEVLNRADEALYQAKANGRNRVIGP